MRKGDKQKRSKGNLLKAVDFFCGAGGMSYGLSQAGVKILGGIDQDSDCGETYKNNLRDADCIEAE